MTTTSQSGSATIYQFPKRGRFAAGATDQTNGSAKFGSLRTVKTVMGGAWYHDEAVEADRVHTN